MITGTSYFVSLDAAVLYYGVVKDVQRKILSGEIHIGKPILKAGETLGTCDKNRRYTIITEQIK